MLRTFSMRDKETGRDIIIRQFEDREDAEAWFDVLMKEEYEIVEIVPDEILEEVS